MKLARLPALVAVLVLVTGGANAPKPLDLTGVLDAQVVPPGGLRTGMTLDAARAAMPTLEKTGDSPHARFGAATLIVNSDRGRISMLTLMFDPDLAGTDIVSAVTARWGAATHDSFFGEASLAWKSARSGWRADLTGCSPTGSAASNLCRLSFRPYVALDKAYFGKRVSLAGPIAPLRMGMTPSEAAAAAPMMSEVQTVSASLAAAYLDGGGNDVQATIWFDAKRITTLELELPMTWADAQALLTAAWGKGRREQDAGATVTVWSDPARKLEARLMHVEAHGGTGASLDRGLLRYVAAPTRGH
jgi:hypothetical protein